MECSKVRERLAAYLEGAVSAEEGLVIGNHLSSCGECRTAMKDLEKTKAILSSLNEVEAPPWLTEKVMARVREEAEEKGGILRWLFYPLRVKIPIEAVAILLVASLVAYVYKANAPQFEAARMAGTAGQTIGQGIPQTLPPSGGQGQAAQAPAAGPASNRITMGGPGTGKGKAEIIPGVSGQNLAQSSEESTGQQREQRAVAANESVQRSASSFQSFQGTQEAREPYEAPGIAATSGASQPEGTSASTRAKASSQQGLAAGRAAPEAAAPPDKALAGKGIGKLDLTIRVKDVGSAAQEVERILGKAGAPRVIRETREGAESVAGVVKTDKIEDLLKGLRGVGDIRDFTPSAEKGYGVAVRVGIEKVPKDEGEAAEKLTK